ncbi:maleylpyruvate isomerase N-terminal domain-containing protein [Mycobacterium paragordonae]|uniref:maleylpyruvate isomerase N-terminal domain-containing protein n=1 Tax=Mycobacterium paragordonae TaxID=1389713 RepID=UPI0014093582|nr:maleylpyruvate isomerase N-terminal domain-containing protein [Mycobacterium paragordonae]
MDRARRLSALRRERAQLIEFLSGLTADEWDAASNADGWRVRDVIAHLGATTRALLGPGMFQVLTSKNAEALNEAQVATRRDWPVEQVVAEFERTSGMAMQMLKVTSRQPLSSLRVPIAELGAYPMGLTPSLLIFDWHVHLRHDIAPALARPTVSTDSERMAAVLEWMFAGLEQMNRHTMAWVGWPVIVELTGVAGGRWRIDPRRRGRLRVTPHGDSRDVVVQIRGASSDFPMWATTRTPWREADLSISGDTAYATRFLDSLNIV